MWRMCAGLSTRVQKVFDKYVQERLAFFLYFLCLFLSTIIINVLLFYPFARNLSINMFVIKREMIWNIKLVRDLYFYHVFKKNEKRKKDEPLNEMF
jgi:tellurite resistance protein TehA-like permease